MYLNHSNVIMSNFVKITSQRQITLPSKILEQIGVGKGEYLSIDIQNNSIILKKSLKIEDIAGMLSETGKVNKDLTPEQIREKEEKGIDKYFREKYRK